MTKSILDTVAMRLRQRDCESVILWPDDWIAAFDEMEEAVKGTWGMPLVSEKYIDDRRPHFLCHGKPVFMGEPA